MLPSRPPWLCKELQTKYPTKNKIYLYYHDPIECLRSFLRSLLLKDHLDFTPRHLFESAENLVCVYTEWLSGDAAWSMQVCFILLSFWRLYSISQVKEKLPPGATLLGTILSSDKTNISAIDDRKSHCSSPSYLTGQHHNGFSHKGFK